MGNTRVVPVSEAKAWAIKHGLTEDGTSWAHEDSSSIKFSVPKESWKVQELCSAIWDWAGPFRESMVWMKDWPSYRTQQMAIIQALRKSWGADSTLMDAPSHIFGEEKSESIGLLMLSFLFDWDAVFAPAPSDLIVVSYAHEGIGVLNAKDEKLEAKIRSRVEELGISGW